MLITVLHGTLDFYQIRRITYVDGRQHVFSMEQPKSDDKDDLFHFISYIPFDGCLYELDGLRSHPICHGAFQGDWIDAARPVIQQRMQKYVHSFMLFP
jgi:ubiquitin carboxyl-terminal hydrolase L5